MPSLPVSNGWVSSLKRKGGNYSSYFAESGLRLTTVHTAILCHVICYRAPDTFTPTYLIDAMQEAAEEIKKYVQVRLLEEKSRIVELQPSDVSEMHFEMERKIPNEHLGAPQFDVTIKALPAKLSSTKLLHKGERVVGVIAHGNMTVASIPFEEEEFEIGARVLHYTYDDHNGLPCVVTKRDDPPFENYYEVKYKRDGETRSMVSNKNLRWEKGVYEFRFRAWKSKVDELVKAGQPVQLKVSNSVIPFDDERATGKYDSKAKWDIEWIQKYDDGVMAEYNHQHCDSIPYRLQWSDHK